MLASVFLAPVVLFAAVNAQQPSAPTAVQISAAITAVNSLSACALGCISPSLTQPVTIDGVNKLCLSPTSDTNVQSCLSSKCSAADASAASGNDFSNAIAPVCAPILYENSSIKEDPASVTVPSPSAAAASESKTTEGAAPTNKFAQATSTTATSGNGDIWKGKGVFALCVGVLLAIL
ncbi:UNVERIFIED_CONTAM: hypothetical protein HDU68_010501 [Siphonaria sp. JEL0065]|nr:hypothetical protein HDU68_010501 [Siphonaria sp. JEL0065]